MFTPPILPVSKSMRPRRPRVGWALIAVLIALPLLYAGFTVSATLDPINKLSQVKAAIVNNDEMVTQRGADGTTSPIALGRLVAGELMSAPEESNYTWYLTDVEDATQGLSDGSYAAVVTIPATFSADAVSTGGDPSKATQAIITVTTNDGTDPSASPVVQGMTHELLTKINKQVTQTYLNNIYLGFSDAQSGLNQAAEGAGQLADGAASLSLGSFSAATGASTLQGGLFALAGGTGVLAQGADEASDGLGQLSAGMPLLSAGAQGLHRGLGSLTSGLSQLNPGATALARGLNELQTGTAELPAQTTALAQGVSQVADGAAQAYNGSAALADGAALTAGIAVDVNAGAQELQEGTAKLRDGAGPLSAAADTLDSGATSYVTQIADLSQNCLALGGSDPLCSALAQLSAEGANLPILSGIVAEGVGNIAAESIPLASGAQQVAAGTAGIETAAHDVAQGVSTLRDGQPGSPGLNALAAGAQQASAGAQLLAASTPALTTGIDKAAIGAKELAQGSKLSWDGSRQLFDGASALLPGVAELSSGTQRLSTGVSSLADGAHTLDSNVSLAADSAGQLAAGLDQLDSGAVALSDGSLTLTNELTQGARALPQYSAGDREALSKVAATPVIANEYNLHNTPSSGYGNVAGFLAIAGWVGALGIFLVLGALPATESNAVGAWRRVLNGLLPATGLALAQAVVMVTVLRAGVGVEVVHLGGLFALSALVAIVFTAINQMLVAAWGTRGQLGSLAFLAVQWASAGVFFPIATAPALLQTLHGWLPMTSAITAYRALISGSTTGVTSAIVTLGLWLAMSLAITLAIARQRQHWKVKKLAGHHDLQAELATARS